MLRDLTKSMLSFSWGMSLFGAKQLVNSLTPEKATAAFDAVTRATEEQHGDAFKGAFRVGDRLQSNMVDMTFSILMLEAFNPSRMMKMASEGRPEGSQERASGWGPVPPPGGSRS